MIVISNWCNIELGEMEHQLFFDTAIFLSNLYYRYHAD